MSDSSTTSLFPQCKDCGARLPATTWRARSCIPCQLAPDRPRLRLLPGDVAVDPPRTHSTALVQPQADHGHPRGLRKLANGGDA